VNLYPPQVQALDKQGALHIADEESGIMVLDDRFYCGNLGVVLEPTATMPLLTG
jgi:hypothetical protein